MQDVPQECVQKWDVEPIVGAPVPQIWEPIVEGVQLAPQERVFRFCSACAFGAYPRTKVGADVTGAADHGENWVCCTACAFV